MRKFWQATSIVLIVLGLSASMLEYRETAQSTLLAAVAWAILAVSTKK